MERTLGCVERGREFCERDRRGACYFFIVPAAIAYAALLGCFLLSGAAGLIHQAAWTREFSLVLGTSGLAFTTALAAQLAGFGVGAVAAARFVDRVTRPVLAFGLLQLGVALSALAVPFGVRASRALYVALFGAQPELPDANVVAAVLFGGATTFGILLVPAGSMGASLPLLARFVVTRDDRLASRAGQLYAAVTLGAVVGTLFAAYLLLPDLGLQTTVRAGTGLNLLVFGFAMWLSRGTAAIEADPRPADGAGDEAGDVRRPWILALIFMSGAASFGYEVLWVRLLDQVLSGTAYGLATMLASMLSGIALGSVLASRFGSTRERAVAGFAIAQLAMAVLFVAAFVAVETLALRTRGEARPDVLLAMLTLFPGAVAIGATFPLAVRVLARNEDEAGRASARVLAAKIFGSILGVVGAGYFALSALGFAGTLMACAALNLVLSAATASTYRAGRGIFLPAAAAAGVALAVVAPQPPWAVLTNFIQSGEPAAGDIAYLGVGRSSTVIVVDTRGHWNLSANGLPEASVSPTGGTRPWAARWMGAMPVLARPDTRTMLLIGLGGGGALESVPSSVERIDVVEPEPQVIAANRALAALRRKDPLADSRVSLHLNDARNAMMLTERRFDAIVSQPSHPWTAEDAQLLTKEFYEIVRARLNEGGVFVQSIGLKFVDESLFRSLLATLTRMFEHVEVYRGPQDSVLFVSSTAPLDHRAGAEIALERDSGEWTQFGVRIPEEVTASLVLDERGARAFAEGGVLNRDASNRLRAESSRVGRRSFDQTIDQVLDEHDPLRLEGLGRSRFALFRSLSVERAERRVEQFDSAVDRDVAAAIVARARAKPNTARRHTDSALAAEPRHVEARALRLMDNVAKLRTGLDATTLIEPPLLATESTLVASWKAQGERDRERGGERLRELDAALEALDPRDPLAAPGQRVRVQWRVEEGTAARGREAVDIVDRNLDIQQDPRNLLLRAQACAAAKDSRAAFAALFDLAGRVADAPRSTALAHGAAQLLRALPEEPKFSASRDQLLDSFVIGSPLEGS